MRIVDGCLVVLFVAAILALSPTAVRAADNLEQNIAQSSILKISPGMSPAVLAGRPDTEFVQLPSGRRLKLGALRRISTLSRKLKQTKVQQLPAALSYQPGPTGIKLRNGADLSAALKRPDNETVQLPSGRLATVGLLRYLQPQVEERLGRKMATAPPRSDLAGPAIKIKSSTDKKYWEDILQKPDSTVLEAPDGQRITVGDLKLALGGVKGEVRNSAPSAAPMKR